MKVTPARLLAFKAVSKARRQALYIHDVLNFDKDIAALDSRERGFCRLLACGVVAARGCLEHIIDRNLNNRGDAGQKLRDALCISVFEMAYLGKEPYIAVSQGVELVRQSLPKACRLANFVLRRIAKDLESFPFGDADTSVDALALKTGHPKWLTERLLSQYGMQAAKAMLESTLTIAPTYVFDASGKADFPNAKLGPIDGCFVLDSVANDQLLTDLADAGLTISDATAQCVARLVVGDMPVEHMLEVGAGRGTKTSIMLSLSNKLHIDAAEIDVERAEVLRKRLENNPRLSVFVGDGRKLDELDGLRKFYDIVFIDAPCSGSGTMRRHPDIVWRLKPDGVECLAALQSELLSEGSKRVKADGRLVYSTCSCLRAENEFVVESFLEDNPGFRLAKTSKMLENQLESSLKSGYFATLPLAHMPDGHFAAVLQRV